MESKDHPALEYAEWLVRSGAAAGELMALLDGYRLSAPAEGKSESTIAAMETAIRLFTGYLEWEGL